MFDAEDEIPQALDTEPEGLDAGFAIALAGEESAQLRDKSYDIADRGRLLGNPRDLALLHIWRTLRQNGGTGLQ